MSTTIDFDDIPIIPVTKAPVSVINHLKTWVPANDTTKWSQGKGGCFVRSLLEVWDREYGIPLHVQAEFDLRMRKDWIERGLYDPSVLSPKFDSLKFTSYGKNLWDWQHFGGSAILEDLERRGSDWAFDAMHRLTWSYYTNENVAYMRSGGKPNEIVYGDHNGQGRLRTAGWLLHDLLDLAKVYKRRGVQGPFADFLVSLINFHLNLIQQNWPLASSADGEKGDHLNVPHWQVFMGGILGNAIAKAKKLGFNVHGLDDEVASYIEAARVGEAALVYDLRLDDQGNPLPPHDDDKIVVGFGGVNSWCIGAVPETSPVHVQLYNNAKIRKVDIQYPHIFAHHFNAVS